jgi:phosphoglycerate dehydrogenase-like enzyme
LHDLNFLLLPTQDDITRGWKRRLEQTNIRLNFQIAETAEEALALISQADAAYGELAPELLAAAGRLRWLQAPYAAPPGGFFPAELQRHPLALTNFRGIYNDHIAVHVMAYILAFARGFHYYLPRQFIHRWEPEPLDTGTVYLPGKTALIVGVGGIGGEIARLCSAFGLKALGIDPRRKGPVKFVDRIFNPAELDEQLPNADFVIVTVPLTPETEMMFASRQFTLMSKSSFFINIGRGGTTSIGDLIAALEAGQIAGAALDVFEEEPLRSDHPLWRTPNVLITPHMASYGPYLDERRFQIIKDNCERFVAGQPLHNIVDKGRGF